MSTFSYGCDFMISLGKQLCTKFEVTSFSHRANIEENPNFWGALLAQGHATLLLHVILRRALANPSSAPNLKSLASAVAKKY